MKPPHAVSQTVSQAVSRAVSRAALASLLLAAAACKGPAPTLQGAIDSMSEQIGELLGAPTLPGKYVKEIYEVHADDRTWRFRDDASKPLERTRDAVRGLSTAEYGSWREAAIVIHLLTTLSESHPSALVRAESLDSLTRMASWTFAAVAPTERKPTSDDTAAAVQRIVKASRAKPDDTSAASELADALDVVASYRFDQSKPLPEKVDLALLARGSRSQLSTARGVLRALTGGALGEWDAEPRVREALDRALVATSAAAIRLALVAAASSAREETVRSTAVRDLEQARPEQTAAILGAIVQSDDQSSVRREASRALRSFPPEQAVPPLLAALGDERLDVRASAASSLAALTGQSFGDDRRAWTEWWEKRSGTAEVPAPADADRK